jgi:hypothetical protein
VVLKQHLIAILQLGHLSESECVKQLLCRNIKEAFREYLFLSTLLDEYFLGAITTEIILELVNVC